MINKKLFCILFAILISATLPAQKSGSKKAVPKKTTISKSSTTKKTATKKAKVSKNAVTIKKKAVVTKKPVAKKNLVNKPIAKKYPVKKPAVHVEDVIVINPEFEAKKGVLPWPAEGNIVINFGRSPYPSLPEIFVKSSGVSINTNRATIAKSVYKGNVKAVISVPGGNKAVIVDHGGYYTLYANLKNVSVKTGDMVIPQQSIGTVYTNDEGNTILDFQLWKGTHAVDPLNWIARRDFSM